MAGNAPKVGRGMRQPSRARYKANNKREINAKKKQAAHARFHDQKACLARGAARRARRAKWQKDMPHTKFADFEKRMTGLSKWESDHKLPDYISTLSTTKKQLLQSIKGSHTIKQAA
jgi:hypothetical protein